MQYIKFTLSFIISKFIRIKDYQDPKDPINIKYHHTLPTVFFISSSNYINSSAGAGCTKILHVMGILAPDSFEPR